VPVKIADLRGHVIVSCQPVKDGPLDRAEFVVGLALAALEGGAAGIRIESPRNVQAVRAATGAPIIGLVKRRILSSPVFITPEISDVQELAGCGADIVAERLNRVVRRTKPRVAVHAEIPKVDMRVDDRSAV
jgi:N-acylglucosamine-6-phosphate 2-epimerase